MTMLRFFTLVCLFFTSINAQTTKTLANKSISSLKKSTSTKTQLVQVISTPVISKTLAASKTSKTTSSATFTGTIGPPPNGQKLQSDVAGNCIDWQCPQDCSDNVCWSQTFGNVSASFYYRCARYIQCMDQYCFKDVKFSYDVASIYVQCDADVANGKSSLSGVGNLTADGTYTGTIPLSRTRPWPSDPKIKEQSHLSSLSPPRPKLVLAYDNVNVTTPESGPTPELVDLSPGGLSLVDLILIVLAVIIFVVLVFLFFFYRAKGYLHWPNLFSKYEGKSSRKLDPDDDLMERGEEYD